MNKWHLKFLLNPLLSQHILFQRLPVWPFSELQYQQFHIKLRFRPAKYAKYEQFPIKKMTSLTEFEYF